MKQALNSKGAKVKYVTTVLADLQHPFIWKYLHPGTIPLSGEHAYYDEVCLSLFNK